MKKNILFFIVLLLFSNYIYAQDISVIFPESATLVNDSVSVDFYIHNLSRFTEQLVVKAHTSPFPHFLSESNILLQPNDSKKISLVLTPLTNQLDSVYVSSLEISSNNYYKKINFQIIQKANRTCSIDVNYLATYIPFSEEYKIEIILKNNSDTTQEIEIIGLKEISISAEISVIEIPKQTEVSLLRIFKTDKENSTLEYRCNGIYGTKEIELPEKTRPKEVNKGPSGLFYFVGAITIINIFDSLLFQIFLIIILIILILSFSTRYLKYIYKRG